MKFSYLFLPYLLPILCQGQVFQSYHQTKEGVHVASSDGTIGIYPMSDNAVRIKFYKNDEAAIPELVFVSSIVTPEFQVSETPASLKVTCKKIQINIKKQTGQLSFSENSGNVFLSEKAETRKRRAQRANDPRGPGRFLSVDLSADDQQGRV
jgi:alpha-D-xyloside xylohydrolase